MAPSIILWRSNFAARHAPCLQIFPMIGEDAPPLVGRLSWQIIGCSTRKFLILSTLQQPWTEFTRREGNHRRDQQRLSGARYSLLRAPMRTNIQRHLVLAIETDIHRQFPTGDVVVCARDLAQQLRK